MRSGKNQFFPGYIKGEIGHFTQIDQQIHRPLEFRLVVDHLLEFPIIGKGEFAVDIDLNPSALVLDDDHGALPGR